MPPGQVPDGIEVEWLEGAHLPFARSLAGIAHLRRALPLERLLPRTIAWARSLPAEVCPQALMADYPRIANHIAATWRDSLMLSHYFESLLVDGRGNRRGFPPQVLRELTTLRGHYFLGIYQWRSQRSMTGRWVHRPIGNLPRAG